MAETQGSLVDDLLAQSNIKTTDATYETTKAGLGAFINEIVAQQRFDEKVTASLVDDLIRELDDKISNQVDEVLHHAEFQKSESSWRSLKFLVEHTNFNENVRITMLNATKDELIEDFNDAGDVTLSSLYKTVYSSEYGQFGGQPYGAVIGNINFTAGQQDLDLLRSLASVSAMSHAPLITSVAPQFFGIDTFEQLPELKDIDAIFESPVYAAWREFRDSEDSKYVGLALPQFLLRAPYGADTVPVKSFNYTETANGNTKNFLWGNAAFAFASRLTDSFAKYRWCANIVGPQGGGTVDSLPVYTFKSMGEVQQMIPTEILISERREFELSEHGFTCLTMRKGSGNAAFFSANSVQRAKVFADTPEGKMAETNFRLGTQLPYMFIVTRLAHYLKVLQRENIGAWKERTDIQAELNSWLNQYIVDMENPLPEIRSKKPLKAATVTVEEVPGEPGWYRSTLQIRPHFKYMGAGFTLSLVGRIDKQ